MPESIHVEVVYPLPQKQELFAVTLPLGATVLQAIEASGILQKYPEIDPFVRVSKFGTFPPFIE